MKHTTDVDVIIHLLSEILEELARIHEAVRPTKPSGDDNTEEHY